MAGSSTVHIPDSDDDFAPPPRKESRISKKVDVDGFLRQSVPPARFYSPEREIPARIAAMTDPERYFFSEWLSEVRKRRAQVDPPPPPHTHN